MELMNLILMLLALFLGLGLGEVASLSAGSSVGYHDSSAVAKNIKIGTLYATTTFAVDLCAATVSLDPVAVNLELRSQQVLIDKPLPTTTITRYSTLHYTRTIPRTNTIYLTRTCTSVPTSGAGKIELRGLGKSTSTSSACPSDLSGEYLSPHLIIPTSSGMPDEPVGAQSMVWISPAAKTLFNFKVPATYTGTCAFIFLFPFMSELDPSTGKYKYSGIEQVEYQNGGLNFALLDGVADNSTTYSTTPPVLVDYGKIKILPGNQYTVSTFACPGGENITIEGSSVNKTELDYFQSSASKPIGLFLVPCI